MPNGQINGSDFLLVEVEDPILDTWEPFYAGWDASGFNGHGGVGIHHPSGDRKKISTYSNSLINSNAYAIRGALARHVGGHPNQSRRHRRRVVRLAHF